MSRPIVVLLCGPHKNGHNGAWSAENILFHRPDAALAEAKRLRVPLIIAGDGWNGEDVNFFWRYAYNQKVLAVIRAFDRRGGTLHDIQAALTVLTDPLWADINEVRFVSDPEHARVLPFARGEAKKMLPEHRRMSFVHVAAFGGPAWSELEIEGELRGIEHYQAGVYGPPHPGLEAYGKLPLEHRQEAK